MSWTLPENFFDSNSRVSQHPKTFEYYVERPGVKNDWQNPTEQELVESVNKLHGFTRQLVTEKTDIQVNLRDVQRALGWSRIWTRILTAALIAQWALIVILGKALLNGHLVK